MLGVNPATEVAQEEVKVKAKVKSEGPL